MTTINCNNSTSISVVFIPNGGDVADILAIAQIDRDYWFTIGYYKSLKTAKRYASKVLAKFGYTFDSKQMEALAI